jgi:hypothetical protein
MGQEFYVEEMLKEFNIQDYRPNQTPMTKGLCLVVHMNTKNIDATKYCIMVGNYST